MHRAFPVGWWVESTHGVRRSPILTRLERASFEVERFELGRDDCLELHGRWFGIRGRRFMRPTLTAISGGREQRVLAALDHKPWVAEEGEAWLAAFPWSSDAQALQQAELTGAPDVTVPLPPPSSPTRRRRARAGSRPTSRDAERASGGGESASRATDDRGANEARLMAEREAALRSYEQALSELDAVKRDREQLRDELRHALAAREADISQRHQVIEAEVRLRIADLRAEAEREREAAGLAAQTARERDAARSERIEARSERDQAIAERDLARRDRNGMLAQRDTARTRAEEATKRFESAAALGTRRTHERDAAAGERDRVTVERDGALEACDRTARERDAALGAHEHAIRERDAAREELRQAVREQAPAPAEREVPQTHAAAPSTQISPAVDRSEQPTEHIPTAAATSSVVRVPRRPAQPRSPIRPRGGIEDHPPAPSPTAASRSLEHAERLDESGSGARTVRRDVTDMWRARLVAIAALLIALVLLIVLLALR